MIEIRFRPSALALTFAICACPSGAAAQNEIVQAINPDADRLAQQMRVLATDPRNLDALIEAGVLSAHLGDSSAAFAFFSRAEAVNPIDPRIMAGRGVVLVRQERPGEALKLFTAAAGRGLAMTNYAADRGFAYDLLGQPTLAQADYRLALTRGTDDEVTRRYALSLGIAGKIDEAMRMLDPLLRRSDRAAWRARAFILAMNGDQSGAEKIAASMMPSNMGQSLTPFFRRLPGMSPADRAFAVHFGSIAPTQARIADARLAPPLPAYVPERPVQVAAAQPTATRPAAAPEAVRETERDRNRRVRRESEREPATRGSRTPLPTRSAFPTRTGSATPAPSTPVRMAATTPTPAAPPRSGAATRLNAEPARTSAAGPISSLPVSTATSSPNASGSLRAATAAPLPIPPAMAAREAAPTVAPIAAPREDQLETPLPARVAPPRSSEGVAVESLREQPPVTVASSSFSLPNSARPDSSASSFSQAPGSASPSPVAAPVPAPSASVGASLAVTATAPLTSSPATPTSPTAIAATPPAAASPKQADSVLAAIVANITIPAEELAAISASVGEPVPAVAAPVPLPARRAAARVGLPQPSEKEAESKKPDAKKAEAKKAEPKKAEPKKPDPAKADPARVWVQVAGGANQSSLPKAWDAVVAKAPASFKGKSGWWTPLRATNRVLTGPFKTTSEAQTFINSLSKSGVSAFVFTSEAGQKVTKLP